MSEASSVLQSLISVLTTNPLAGSELSQVHSAATSGVLKDMVHEKAKYIGGNLPYNL